HPPVRLRRLARLVCRARLVSCRFPQPAFGHAQLGVELPYLRAKRAAHHRSGPGAACAGRSPFERRNPMNSELQKEMKALGQSVLVLQGGGALGAYQVGVYEALSEAGVEPDWIVGTSI